MSVGSVMEIEIRVKDFLGVRDVAKKFGAGGVCRISGANASGKSSTLMGIGICMAQLPNPHKLNIGQMGQYAHNGSLVAAAQLRIGDWFDVRYSVKGGLDITSSKELSPTQAVEVCAGLVDPLEWRQKEWNGLFRSVMIDYPTFANALLRDWDAAVLTGDEKVDNANKQARVARRVYDSVQEHGLAAVLEKYREHLRNAKRDWEKAASGGDAGKNTYGKEKAFAWRPSGWHESWSELSDEETAAEVVLCRENLDVIKSQLVQDDTMRQHHESLAAEEADRKATVDRLKAEMAADSAINSLEKKHSAATNACQTMQNDLNDAERRQAENRRKSVDGERHECPHCEGIVVMIDGKLIIYNEEAEMALNKEFLELDEEVKEKRAAVKKHAAEMTATAEQIKTLKDEHMKGVRRAVLDLSASIDAAKWLKRNPPNDNTMTADDITAAEVKLRDAENRQKLVRVVRLALAAAESCYEYQNLIKSLDTGRVSKAFEEVGLGGIRRALKGLGQHLGFHVELEGGVLMYDGRAVSFCSESEQWITRFAIQLSLASHFGIPLVLVDRFDVLDVANARRYLEFFDSRNAKRDNGKPGALSIIVAGTNRTEQKIGDLEIVAGKRETIETTGDTES